MPICVWYGGTLAYGGAKAGWYTPDGRTCQACVHHVEAFSRGGLSDFCRDFDRTAGF